MLLVDLLIPERISSKILCERERQMKTYLFDFDGTLVDSMPSFIRACLSVLDDHNIKYKDDIIKTITPLGFAGTARHYISLGVDMPEETIVAEFKKRMLDDYLYKIPSKNNVLETLKQLKKDGACLNVLTASPHDTLDPCLKRIGLYDLFTNVWSCDDFHTSKADPNIYIMAAEKIGVPVGEILFLDDNIDADKTAKSAGMKVCGVYDDSSRNYVEPIKAVADYYIYDFAELSDIKF
ncbi:MAG: HAD family hydrolase [Ruminococcaceae bacterium]|nr:HAD family hydrolase [Oscillospiraceae bacterium]